MRTLTSLAVGVIIGAGTVGAGAQASDTNRYHGPAKRPAFLATHCAVEDDINCYWDARTAGNKMGHSFWTIKVNRNRACTVYWDPRYSARHGQCFTP